MVRMHFEESGPEVVCDTPREAAEMFRAMDDLVRVQKAEKELNQLREEVSQLKAVIDQRNAEIQQLSAALNPPHGREREIPKPTDEPAVGDARQATIEEAPL